MTTERKTPWTPEPIELNASHLAVGRADFQRYKEAYEALYAALDAALDCLDEVLEDTDGPDGELVPNPLLVEARDALALATEKP